MPWSIMGGMILQGMGKNKGKVVFFPMPWSIIPPMIGCGAETLPDPLDVNLGIL